MACDFVHSRGVDTSSLILQTSSGPDIGYGIRMAGTHKITGIIVSNTIARGQVSVMETANTNDIQFEFDLEKSTIAAAGLALSYVATLVTGPLKVVLYSGPIFSIHVQIASLTLHQSILLRFRSVRNYMVAWPVHLHEVYLG